MHLCDSLHDPERDSLPFTESFVKNLLDSKAST
jgi:hypothetical protein